MNGTGVARVLRTIFVFLQKFSMAATTFAPSSFLRHSSRKSVRIITESSSARTAADTRATSKRVRRQVMDFIFAVVFAAGRCVGR